jgi:hypothetical protein
VVTNDKEEEWEQGMWIERATVGELSTHPLGANPEPPSTMTTWVGPIPDPALGSDGRRHLEMQTAGAANIPRQIPHFSHHLKRAKRWSSPRILRSNGAFRAYRRCSDFVCWSLCPWWPAWPAWPAVQGSSIAWELERCESQRRQQPPRVQE